MALCKNCALGLLVACKDGVGCKQEREILIEEATYHAEQQGHSLTEFIKIKDVPKWQSVCKHCSGQVTIHLDPLPGEATITGILFSNNQQKEDLPTGIEW